MPIYSIEGTPGAGKTLYCVQKVIPDFLKIRDYRGDLDPRHIYTNIEGLKPWLICAYIGLPYEAIADYFHVLGRAVDENGKEYEDKDLVRYWFLKPESIRWQTIQNGNRQLERVPDWDTAEMIERNALVIIDEVQNYYGSRDFAKDYSRSAIDFLTKNRHYGWTLWWMTTNIEQVDVNFRRNTQQVFWLEKKENYGNSNAAVVKKYEGWLAGDKTLVEPYAKENFSYDKRFFHTYKSYVDGVQGEKRYKTNVFLAHRGFVALLVVFALCVVAMVFTNPLKVLRSGGVDRPQRKTATEAATQQQPQASRPAVSSFSVTAGREALDTSVCVRDYFVVKNKTWALLNTGKRVEVKQGAAYADCH